MMVHGPYPRAEGGGQRPVSQGGLNSQRQPQAAMGRSGTKGSLYVDGEKRSRLRERGGERFYVEDERGTKLILLGLVGRVEDAQEEFEYRRGDLSFEVLATRVDTNSRAVRDHYTVWLGMAFKKLFSQAVGRRAYSR